MFLKITGIWSPVCSKRVKLDEYVRTRCQRVNMTLYFTSAKVKPSTNKSWTLDTPREHLIDTFKVSILDKSISQSGNNYHLIFKLKIHYYYEISLVAVITLLQLLPCCIFTATLHCSIAVLLQCCIFCRALILHFLIVALLRSCTFCIVTMLYCCIVALLRCCICCIFA